MSKPKTAVPSPSRLLQGLSSRVTPSASRSRYAVDIVPISTEEVDGVEVTTYGVDFASAERPSRSYSPDLAEVRLSRDELLIIFAQLSLNDQELDSALVLRVPPRGVGQFLESLAKLTGPSISDIQNKFQIEPEPLAVFDRNPKQLVKMNANVIHVAISGLETCLNFFQSSADARLYLPQTNTIELEPIVRVDLKTSTFLSIKSKVEEFFPQLPRYEGQE